MDDNKHGLANIVGQVLVGVASNASPVSKETDTARKDRNKMAVDRLPFHLRS